MAKHRTHSIAFKRQIVQEYLAGETLHGLVRMDLVLRGDLLKCPLAPKRLQRNLRLQFPRKPASLAAHLHCMDASRMARTDVRVMGQADCSFVFGLFLQELSLLALMESADPRLISSVGSWP